MYCALNQGVVDLGGETWAAKLVGSLDRVFLRFFDFDPDGDDLSLVEGRKEGRKEPG